MASMTARLTYLLVILMTVPGCAHQILPDSAFVKSANDQNSYRYVVLDNQLRVLLISDPKTDKATASLDVHIGGGADPDDRQGLAHFLEHMLFLGTDKYPGSGEYQQFISEHGGSHNAYTTFEHTNYFFDIDKQYIEPALDRFAQFFIAPRFDAEYVAREKHAVHSEYQAGIKNDGRRSMDAMREVINPEHPLNNFSVGSLETLADRDNDLVREDLLKFYGKYYSANIMTLVVLGQESLDELQVMVKGRFGKIPNHRVTLNEIKVPLFVPESFPLWLELQPEATIRQLQLLFPMPNYSGDYHTKPMSYISNVLGHEGQGSLLSVLKAKGWVEGLAAGSSLSYRGGSALGITINLTEQGVKNLKAVVANFFQMVSLLSEEGVTRKSFEEQQKILDLQFRYKEKTSPSAYARGLANDLHYFSPLEVLSGHYIMDEFKPALIKDLLGYIKPKNMLVTLIDKSVEGAQKSRHYGVPYDSRRLSEQDSMAFGSKTGLSVATALALPADNEFIAENLQLISSVEDQSKIPVHSVDEDAVDIWYLQDQQFSLPKGVMKLNVRSPRAVGTAGDAALMELYVRSISDAVNEFVYPASLAGLEFGISRHARGMTLQVGGYNDKQLVLLQRLLQAMQTIQYQAQRFGNIQSELIRQLENSRTAKPFTQLLDNTRELLQSYEWTESELVFAIKNITLDDVKLFDRQFWAGARVEMLMYGNYSKQDVVSVKKILDSILPALPLGDLPAMRIVKLNAGQRLVHEVEIDHPDSSIVFYMQGASDSWPDRAAAALTNQILRADFFQQLRTEQQLGYIVAAYPYPILEVPGIAFVIQSPVADAGHLFKQTKAFLQSVELGSDLTDEQFNGHRRILVQELQEKSKNIWEQASRYWKDIGARHYDFDSREHLTEALLQIELADWREYFDRQLTVDERSVLLFSAGRWPDQVKGLLQGGREPLELFQLDAFQGRQGFYQRH